MVSKGSRVLVIFAMLKVLCVAQTGCKRDKSDDSAGDRPDAPVEASGASANGGEGDLASESLLKVIKTADVPTCKGGDVQLYADLAYPEPSEKLRPGLVFIHGGGWTSGSRKDFKEFISFAASRGYVAASIQYRLSEPVFPNEIFDVKCAVRWLRAESERYGVDPDMIGAFGASAGGHLALILGSTSGLAALEGDGDYKEYSSAVQAVVNWFGPTDLAALYNTLDAEGKAGFEKNLGGPPSSQADVYARYSPLTYVSSMSAPTITVHGDADPLVPYAQGLALKARFEAVEGTHEFLTIPGGGHGFPPVQTLEAIDGSFTFLNKVLPTPDLK